MIDPQVTEYHRLRSVARLPDAGYLWDWDDNVSPTIAIREISRRADLDDPEAIADRDWIRRQVETKSKWHQRNWTMIVYREWLEGKPYDPARAHLYEKGGETNLPEAERAALKAA